MLEVYSVYGSEVLFGVCVIVGVPCGLSDRDRWPIEPKAMEGPGKMLSTGVAHVEENRGVTLRLF